MRIKGDTLLGGMYHEKISLCAKFKSFVQKWVIELCEKTCIFKDITNIKLWIGPVSTDL